MKRAGWPRKALSVLISAYLIVSLMPAGAWAQATGEPGADSPASTSAGTAAAAPDASVDPAAATAPVHAFDPTRAVEIGPPADETGTTAGDDDTSQGGAPRAKTEVTASSATENIVGEVFANAANEALSRQVPEGEESAEDPSLEEYPTESRGKSYYEGSPRLRTLVGKDGDELGFLVYRDTFTILTQEASARYTVTQSDDGSVARVTPAIDPATLDGKTGIVFLREDVGADTILVFDVDAGHGPYLEGDTLVVPLEATEDIALNQLFSDGSIHYSGGIGQARGASRLKSDLAQDDASDAAAGRRAMSLQGASGLRTALGSQAAAVGTQASYAPTFHLNPSGTNWKANIDYSSISIDEPAIDFDIDIMHLKFDLVVKLGVAFDFDVTSTGASRGRESVEIIGLDVAIELFNLHYAALFEAEFDNHPVHAAGRMSATMDFHWNPVFGVSMRNWKAPVKLRTFELTNPERDKNQDVSCYLGTGFEINQSFLEVKLDLLLFDIHFGPVASLNQRAQGGTSVTARLEKDTYDPHAFDRTQSIVHICAERGKAGCYTISTRGESAFNWNAKLDLYFTSKVWDIEDEHSFSSAVDFHHSLTYEQGLQPGPCPYRLCRVPVAVWGESPADNVYEVPLANMDVSVHEDLGIGDEAARLATGKTDSSGKAVVYLPVGKYWTLVASGMRDGLSVVGSRRQLNLTNPVQNEQVNIVVSAAERQKLDIRIKWNVDAAGKEVPGISRNTERSERLRLQWRKGGDGAWEDYTDRGLLIFDGIFDIYEEEGWHRELSLPKYAFDEDNRIVLCDYRVSVVPLDEFGDEKQMDGPYVEHNVEAYADASGTSEAAHRGKYHIAYAEERGDSGIAFTITETAVLDIALNKQWLVADKGAVPDSVYLALQARPEIGFETLAARQGVPDNWTIAANPLEGAALTLRNLADAGALTFNEDIESIADVPLAVGEANASNKWTSTFTVPKFRNGVKLRYRAAELDKSIVGDFLLSEYDLDVSIAAHSDTAYDSRPGDACSARSSWERAATVINTDAGSKVLAGTVRWAEYRDLVYGIEMRPSGVVVHVSKNGAEIGQVPLSRSDHADTRDNVWGWTLPVDEVDPDAEYTATLTYNDNKSEWGYETSGLDVFNRIGWNDAFFNVFVVFDDSVNQDALGLDELDVTCKSRDGSASERVRVRRANRWWARAIDIEAANKITPKGAEAYLLEAEEVPELDGYVRVYKEPYISYYAGNIQYNYTVYYVPRDQVTLEVSNTWAGDDASTVFPSMLNLAVYRDNEKIAELSKESGGGQTWVENVSADANGMPLYRVSETGHRYLYSVRQEPVEGFTTTVAETDDGSSKIAFKATNTWVGPDYVNVSGTVTWDDGGNARGSRPDEVSLTVVNGKGESVRVIKVPVGSDDTFTYEAKYLPGKDADGNPITYSVVESHVPYYTPVYATPAYDASSRTWTCDITNTLTGFCPITVKKAIEGAAPSEAETYTFDIAKYADDSPDPRSSTVQVTGAGEATAEFLIDEDGLYLYSIKERAGANADCAYDASKKVVLIARTTGDDGRPTFKTWTGEVASDADDPGAEVGNDNDGAITAEEQAMLNAISDERSNTVTFTNKYPGITVEKKWGIDLEDKDRPGSVQAVVQKKDDGEWKTVETVELSADNGWKTTVAYPDGADANGEYRVRELGEETVGSLVDGRIVYDKGDADKPDGSGATANEVTFHVGAYLSTVEGSVDAHITKYRVTYSASDENNGKIKTFTIENKAIVEVDVIKRWIGVGVDDEDMPESAWVVLMAKPKAGALDAAKGLADAAGIDLGGVLDYEFPVINPLEGGSDPLTILGRLACGVDVSFIAKAAKALFGIKVPELAIGRVTADDNWTLKVVNGKYTSGIPLEYKGAELGSEIIRLVIKYLTDGLIDSPVSYNPFDNYISIPTKAIQTVAGIEHLSDLTDFSGLGKKALAKAKSLTMEDIGSMSWQTLTDPGHYMANVINVKVDWDTHEDEEPPDDANKVHGQKTWDDQNDKYGTRPDKIKVYLLANGQRVKDDGGNDVYVETSKAGGWRYSFNDRDATDANGKAIVYTVEEEAVAGYTPAYNGYDIVNTMEMSELVFTKLWDDDNDRDGMRPDKVDVRLLADGKEVAAHTVTAAGKWTWNIGKMPTSKGDGSAVVYTVEEVAVPSGYVAVPGTSESGKLSLLNRHEPETVTLRMLKRWDDDGNRDGLRPDRINLHVKAGGKVVQTRTLRVDARDNDLWFTVTLPKNENGKPIAYTLDEDPVAGYAKSWNADKTQLTNTHTPERVTISGVKAWDDAGDQDGKRPDSVTVNLLANGRKVASQRVTADNGWRFSFENVYKNELSVTGGAPKSRPISYTVDEDEVEDYETAVTGDAAGGFTITNTHEPETTTVEGAKAWAGDDGDADGNRPGRITVTLLADGEEAATQTVTAANDWKWSFTGLPKYKDGREISYSVREEPVVDYISETAGNGRDITNTYAPETVTISGKKVWDDGDDADRKRPSSVTVRLRANGTVRATKTVTAADGWRFSFTAPARLDGADAVYTVSEDAVEGYTTSIAGTAADGFTITNRYTPEKVQVDVFKGWFDDQDRDGLRPASVTVRLLAKHPGQIEPVDTGESLELDESNGWMGTFTDLNKNEGGSEIIYSITEDAVPGYEAELIRGTDDQKNAFLLINRHKAAEVDIAGTKAWDDDGDRDGLRPASVRVWLLSDGMRIAWKDVTASSADAQGRWEWRFDGFPKYRNGEEVVYTVEEEPVAGYETSISGSAAEGFAIVNTHEPAKVAVSAMKLWDDSFDNDGKRPASVTVRLRADGADAGKSLMLDEGNGWWGDFGEFYRYEAGRPIDYTVAEDPLPASLGYGEPTYEYYKDPEKVVAFVTNERSPEFVEIKGDKYWLDSGDAAGKRPDAVTLWLCIDGERVLSQEVTAPVGEDSEDVWPWTFGEWPRYVFGREVAYTVEEEPVVGYETVVTAPGVSGGKFLIANEFSYDLTYLEVAHLWIDGNDQDGKRPESLTLRLYANGVATDRTLTITKDDDWEGIFTRLRMYSGDSGGEKIDYTVAVDEGDPNYAFYEKFKFGSTDWGYALIDIYEPELVTVQGTKAWNDADDQDGIRPEKVEVVLYADGQEAGRCEATAAGGWAWAFEGLPRFAGGVEIAYTVSEAAVEGYESSISGSAEEGFAITNTHEPETVDVDVCKVWDDGDDADGLRPGSVTVRLLADGADTGKALTLDAGGGWKGTFAGLPAKRGGESVVYTVAEDAVSGYEAVVTGDASSGYTITNRHEPVVPPSPVRYTITYDLNGGTFDGSAGNIVESYPEGAVIAIHEAPVREGYAFLYWKGSHYRPGDEYTVTGDHTFIAQWEKNPVDPDNPTPNDPTPNDPTPKGPTPGGPTPGDSSRRLVKTADENLPLIPIGLEACGAALCIIAFVRRCRVK